MSRVMTWLTADLNGMPRWATYGFVMGLVMVAGMALMGD
jgi:tetrahydromethanopterin S-methyltransferase subunit B